MNDSFLGMCYFCGDDVKISNGVTRKCYKAFRAVHPKCESEWAKKNSKKSE